MKLNRIAAITSLVLIVSIPAVASPQESGERRERQRVIVRQLTPGSPIPGMTNLRRGFLGVQLTEMTAELREHFGAPRDRGVLVSGVSEDSPASRAGIRVGDVITEVARKPVSNYVDVIRTLSGQKDGDRIEVRLMRHGAPVTVTTTIEERDRQVVSINRLPEGVQFFDASSVDKLQEFFEGDEWRERVFRLQDCAESQDRLRALENRLRELEQRIK